MHRHGSLSPVPCKASSGGNSLDDGKDVYCGPQVNILTQKSNAAGPSSLADVAAIGLEMLEGLDQLHGVGVRHLDLKPANVLLDNYGHAYLSDFGISCALQTLETCATLTSVTGTPHYM